MSGKEEQQYPSRIQWLAGAAGCAAGAALWSLSWILSFAAIFLIVGAAVPRWFPRAGRWFILAPALLLSAIILPIGIANPGLLVWNFLVGPHDFIFVGVSLVWLLSPILLIWCITAVLTDCHTRRRLK